jgi:hypothetical protein
VRLDEERERYMSDLVQRLRKIDEREMEKARVLSNMRDPERDNECGRTAVAAREAADRIEALEEELEREREAYQSACGLVARMHHAATGSITGPRLGVVEDVAAVEKDARRYQWLRCRVVVRTQESLAGSRRPGLDIAIGGTYFDVRYSARDYEVSKLEAAIDAVLDAEAAAQNVASARRPDQPETGAGITSQDTPQG